MTWARRSRSATRRRRCGPRSRTNRRRVSRSVPTLAAPSRGAPLGFATKRLQHPESLSASRLHRPRASRPQPPGAGVGARVPDVRARQVRGRRVHSCCNDTHACDTIGSANQPIAIGSAGTRERAPRRGVTSADGQDDTGRHESEAIAKVRVAGSNPVVRSKVLSTRTFAGQRPLRGPRLRCDKKGACARGRFDFMASRATRSWPSRLHRPHRRPVRFVSA